MTTITTTKLQGPHLIANVSHSQVSSVHVHHEHRHNTHHRHYHQLNTTAQNGILLHVTDFYYTPDSTARRHHRRHHQLELQDSTHASHAWLGASGVSQLVAQSSADDPTSP